MDMLACSAFHLQYTKKSTSSSSLHEVQFSSVIPVVSVHACVLHL